MPSNKDYSQVPLEELIQQEQKMQSRKTTTAVFVGVLLNAAAMAVFVSNPLPADGAAPE